MKTVHLFCLDFPSERGCCSSCHDDDYGDLSCTEKEFPGMDVFISVCCASYAVRDKATREEIYEKVKNKNE